MAGMRLDPTMKVIREPRGKYIPREADLALLTPEMRERVESGEVYMGWPRTWMFPHRPVLRDVKTTKLVKGSGKIVGSKDVTVAGRENGFKKRRGYVALTEEFIPPSDLKDNPNAILTFRELVETLIDACMGSPQEVKCPSCGAKGLHAFKKDAATLFKLYENLKGKARETTDVNVMGQHLVAVLNERMDVREVVLHSIDPVEEQRRRSALGVE